MFKNVRNSAYLFWGGAFAAVLLTAFIVSEPVQAGTLDDPEGFPQVMDLTLTDAVMLALRYNRSLESAYLDRVLARFNLRRDLTEFYPDIDVQVTADAKLREDFTTYKGGDKPSARTSTQSAGTMIKTTLTQKVPTGAEITFTWDAGADSRRTSTRSSTGWDEPLESGWEARFSQPLLKDGGWTYSTASIKETRIMEEDAVRALRDRVIAIVSNVITAYRDLLRVYQDLKVQRASLAQAREQMEITRLLIETGRRAANEILQSEANVARQELAMEEARTRLDDAQLKLLELLNIGRDITIVPTESVEYRIVEPDFQECLRIAFERNTGYLSAQNQVTLSQLAIMKAENQRKWDLSLDAGYRQGWHRDHHDPDPDSRLDVWDVGLRLTIPLPVYGNQKYSREQGLLAARINLRKRAMDAMSTEENLENQVRNAVQRVDSARRQVDMARRTLEFSEKSFEATKLEFRLGRISNNDYIREQEKLRDDQLAEINSIIAYENAMTSLDKLLATTLETWEIDFVPHRADLEEELLGRKTWMLGD
jgi:outer membrane protein TolC